MRAKRREYTGTTSTTRLSTVLLLLLLVTVYFFNCRVTGKSGFGSGSIDPQIQAAIDLHQRPKQEILETIRYRVREFQDSKKGIRAVKAPTVFDPSWSPCHRRPSLKKRRESPVPNAPSSSPSHHCSPLKKRRVSSVPATVIFEKGDRVMALYNSWTNGKIWYEATVLQGWFDLRERIRRYKIVYKDSYEGKKVIEYGVQAKYLRYY